ncbi:MAG TPA: hypothetical protein VKE40_17330 [Gemmataceae bacterium]|nr:hypothetical protein [Gemmataceae bacterium]
MRQDLHNNIKATRGISPVAASIDNTPFVSQILDTADFGSAEFLGQFGAIADADVTFTVLVEHGDQANLSDAAAVPDEQLLGVEAMVDASGVGLRFDSDDKTFKIGYIGTKRYVRVTVTPANNTGNIFLAGIWVRGHPRRAPQSVQIN